MIEFLFLLIGLFIGFVAAWLWMENKLHLKFDLQLKAKEAELLTEKEARIRSEAELKAYLQANKETEERLSNHFKVMANEALRTNHESFLQLAGQSFQHQQSQNKNLYSKQQKEIENIITPLREGLNKQEELIHHLQNQTGKTFGSVSQQIEQLMMSQKSLEKETGTLVSALKSPRVRGRWGEIGLKRVVEFSGMSAYCDFQEQVHQQTDTTSVRPDMIVQLPENRKIIVDSKLPLSAFLELLETDDEAERKLLQAKHAQALARHARDLGSKAYWNQFDDSIDFVILYIEIEPAFAAAITENVQLVQEAIQNRVVFATPTTLITMLQTIAYSWKQHKATENAIQIWKQSKEVYQRLATFSDYMQKIGNSIHSLTKVYNQSVGSWESRVQPSIKRLEELGVDTNKKEVENLTPVETPVRLPKN